MPIMLLTVNPKETIINWCRVYWFEEIEEILIQVNNSITEQIDLDDQENICELLEKLVWSIDCVREK